MGFTEGVIVDDQYKVNKLFYEPTDWLNLMKLCPWSRNQNLETGYFTDEKIFTFFSVVCIIAGTVHSKDFTCFAPLQHHLSSNEQHVSTNKSCLFRGKANLTNWLTNQPSTFDLIPVRSLHIYYNSVFISILLSQIANELLGLYQKIWPISIWRSWSYM